MADDEEVERRTNGRGRRYADGETGNGITVRQLSLVVGIFGGLLAIGITVVTLIVTSQMSQFENRVRASGSFVPADSERDYRDDIGRRFNELAHSDEVVKLYIGDIETRLVVRLQSIDDRLRAVELRQADALARIAYLERRVFGTSPKAGPAAVDLGYILIEESQRRSSAR